MSGDELYFDVSARRTVFSLPLEEAGHFQDLGRIKGLVVDEGRGRINSEVPEFALLFCESLYEGIRKGMESGLTSIHIETADPMDNTLCT